MPEPFGASLINTPGKSPSSVEAPDTKSEAPPGEAAPNSSEVSSETLSGLSSETPSKVLSQEPAKAPSEPSAVNSEQFVIKGSASQTPLRMEQEAHALKLKKSRLRLFIFRFLTAWAAFMVVLVGISLLTNLEWARPKVEQAMSDSFHRKVRLGWLSWTLGLNGLAISTNKLSMMEADGKPFILSGPSEIGIAFMPLFKKRLIIKHVDFHSPEVFATQLSPGKWNFSDLLVEGPEIRYVEVDDGKLHMRNLVTEEQLKKNNTIPTTLGNTKWRSYDFQSVAIKLIFPKKGQRRPWPFYLAFKLPGDNAQGKYVSEFSLTLLANGTFDDWRKRPCTIEARGQKMNPDDWRPFFGIPSGVAGLTDFKFRGQGVLTDAIKGEIVGSAEKFSVANGGQNVFFAPKADWQSKLTVHPDYFLWDELKFNIAGLKMLSEGRMDGWQKANPTYNASIKADLKSLSELSDTSFWRLLPGFGGEKAKKPELSGSALIEVKIQSDGKSQKIYTTLKADDIPLGHLVPDATSGGAAFLSLFEVEPEAPIKGGIEIGHDQRILLKDVQIPSKGSVLTISGFIDAPRHQHDISVKAADFVLDKFDTSELEPKHLGKKANSNDPPVMLSGKIDIDGRFKQDGNRQTVAVLSKLKDAVLSSGHKVILASGLKGDLNFDGTNLTFKNVSGGLATAGSGAGTFSLNGFVPMSKTAHCALEVVGHHVDLAQLSTFVKAAHIPVPADVLAQMHGVARDMNIKITGTSAAPVIALRLVPEEFLYQLGPSNGVANKPVKITGGLITSTGNSFELKDVTVTTQTGKMNLSGTFDGEHMSPRVLHIKTSAIEISEVQQLLKSSTLPRDLYKNLSGSLEPLKLSKVQGKAYGDLNMTFAGQTQSVDGVMGFYNATGQLGVQAGTFDHLSGIVALAGNNLTIQELTATSGLSRFTLTGDVKNYQQSPSWNLQLAGAIRPQDLAPMLPFAWDTKKLQLVSSGPLTSQSTITGDFKNEKIVFTAQAEPADNLQVRSSFASLSQPSKQSVGIDGTLLIVYGPSSSIHAQNCHLTIGESVIQASGKYDWSDDGKTEPTLEVVMNTPTAIPTGLVVGSLCPNVDVTGAAGTIKGTFAMAGNFGDLLTHGDATLSHVVLPAMNIKDLDGKIHTPRWSIVQDPQQRTDSLRSEAKVELGSAIFAGLPARDVVANIVLENGPEPRISISKGTASIAGGSATIDAYYLPQTGKWHMDLGLSKLYVDQFMADLIEHSGEVTGLADGKITLEGAASDWNNAVANMQGHGDIAVYKGSVPRVGQLQEKLTQANLLQQGIFGFNLNNVMQTVLPVKYGKFKEASVHFDVANGVVDLDRMIFDGKDLRLRAAGTWNLGTNTLNIDVAGNIPRVATSILPGAVGEVSRNFTIQKAVRVMTFNKLENLPSVPILGDIGTDDPRAFTFKIASVLDGSNGVTNSIGKSFKWLPNKPNASAHPIPGQAM